MRDKNYFSIIYMDPKKTKFTAIITSTILIYLSGFLIYGVCYFYSSRIFYIRDTVERDAIKSNQTLCNTVIVAKNDISYLEIKYNEPLCAGYIKKAYNKLARANSEKKQIDYAHEDGIFGNAWELPCNIIEKGGKVFKIQNIDKFPFKRGDIIGCYYPLSSFNEEAAKWDSSFTHVVIIIGFIKKKPVVAHLFRGWLLPNSSRDRIDYLSQIGPFKPVVVMRTGRNF